MAYQITSLTGQHGIKDFDCGTPALNAWLQNTAGQHQAKLLSRTSVLIEDSQPTVVLGYHALALRGLVQRENLPIGMGRRLPDLTPALTLARLAVAKIEQGQGHGGRLLTHALSDAKKASSLVGGHFLFVDAKDAKAAAFYAHYGFIALPSSPSTLTMAIASIP